MALKLEINGYSLKIREAKPDFFPAKFMILIGTLAMACIPWLLLVENPATTLTAFVCSVMFAVGYGGICMLFGFALFDQEYKRCFGNRVVVTVPKNALFDLLKEDPSILVINSSPLDR